MAGRLDGKVAAITGGVSGIGLATVKRFLEEGAKVVIGDIQTEPGARLEDELGPNVRFQATNVSNEDEVAALVDRAVDEFGRLDCMFNNAGFGGVGGEITELDLGEAYRVSVDVLFTAVLSGTKHAAHVMKSQGSGSIVNTASIAGLRAGYGGHVYSAMKSAVISVTRSTAVELGPSGVRVNAICPGFIATAIFVGQRNWNYDTRMRFVGELEQNQTANSPIQRAGLGRDIANMALHLASDDAEFVTGQHFVVDGGLTAGGQRDPNRRNRFQEIAERIETESSQD